MRIWIPTTAIALFAVACAPAPDSGTTAGVSEAGRCFDADRIANFTVDGQSTIHVRSHRGEVFELKGTGGCPDVDFASALSITPVLPVGPQRICVGQQARVQPLRLAASPGAQVCRFDVTRALSSDEAAALPDRNRP